MKLWTTAALALAALAALAGCGDEQSAAKAPPPEIVRPAITMVVEASAVTQGGYPGSIQPRSSSALSFPLIGRVIERDADVGDQVRLNQRLSALDPLPYQLAVQSALSSLEGARAQRDQALGAESRAAALVQGRAASQATFDSARLAREAADASVNQAAAALAKAQEQLDQTVLYARFEGVVTAVSADPGQTVQAGQAILTVSDLSRLEAVIDPPEEAARALGQSARFEIRLRQDPTVKAMARVREIAPQADSASRTRRMRLTLETPPKGAFWSGVSIDAFPLGTPGAGAGKASGFMLPNSAILTQGGAASVWVVDPASLAVSARAVKVEPLDDKRVRVLEGLSGGERVVVSGVHSLEAGRRVRLAEGEPK